MAVPFAPKMMGWLPIETPGAVQVSAKASWRKDTVNMAKDMHGEERTVKELPDCFFCWKEHKAKVPARYDARIKEGPWRKMCAAHMKERGIGVGIGYGQRLWLATEKHAPGECPIKELPPYTNKPREVCTECDICGASWFVRALEYIAGKGYCPKCLRECFPVRKDGPFTYGDIVAVTYPDGDDAGVYIGRVLTIPEQNVIEVRFEYEEDEPEDVMLAMDSFGNWWDVDNERPGIRVRHGVAAEAAEYERLRKARVEGYSEGRPTRKQLAPWGGLFEQEA